MQENIKELSVSVPPGKPRALLSLSSPRHRTEGPEGTCHRFGSRRVRFNALSFQGSQLAAEVSRQMLAARLGLDSVIEVAHESVQRGGGACACAPYDAGDVVSLLKEELREVRAVLASNSGD